MRRALIVLLVVAVVVLLGAAAMILVPILSHHSAGGSGQTVPDEIVSEARATGADGRTRELRVDGADGAPADLGDLRVGEILTVHGTGFDPSIGIYVGICVVPEPGERPTPCLGGLPEGALEAHEPEAPGEADPLSSVWITDDWAWRAFATQGYDDAETGSFTARLIVVDPVQEGLDCTRVRCAVTTRADHTALGDRVQDLQLPVAFAR